MSGISIQLSPDVVPENVVYVNELADFGTPSNSVYTLAANKTYIITTAIDLDGGRLVTGGVCNLLGLSSEVSSITSTGLAEGTAMITSAYTIVIENITFKDVDTCISINGTDRLVALDWENVNFSDIPNVGVINTCDNFIMETSAFLSAQGLRFTGTIGTVGILNTLLVGTGAAGNIIELDASCIITRRFRISYSSVVAVSPTVGINVNASTTIPVEAYILDTVNFAGGGTYISGTLQDSNKALFTACTAIQNTAVNGQLFMVDNAVATVIEDTTNFVKVVGTTTASVDNQKYAHSNNRLTNEAVIKRKYLITASLSFTAGANNVCQFGFFDSELDDIRTPSKIKSTANTGGRAENITLQCVVSHSVGNYIEVWARNTSNTTNITVTDMNLVITEIK